MRFAQTAFVVLPRLEFGTGSVAGGGISSCAAVPGPTAPMPSRDHRRNWLATLVILVFAYLLYLAPLLHAHPANNAGPATPPAEAHPVGIHLPEQSRAPVFLAADGHRPAPSVTLDTRALATIVVAELHRRDGSPTPADADPSVEGPPRVEATPRSGAPGGRRPAPPARHASHGWPAYFAMAPPAPA